jgi:hypothetical protein
MDLEEEDSALVLLAAFVWLPQQYRWCVIVRVLELRCVRTGEKGPVWQWSTSSTKQ